MNGTNIDLHMHIADAMKHEGWMDRTPDERMAEHRRRYQERIAAPHALTPAGLIGDLTGGAADIVEHIMHILAETNRLRDEITKWRNEVEYLETRARCSGWTHVNAAGSLYIHHRTGAACPLHGDEIRDRGRVYVGRNIEKCQAATEALANYNAWTIASATLSETKHDLQRIETALAELRPHKQKRML